MIIFLSLAVCIAGALIYGFSVNAKAGAVGLHMFWVWLLVFLLRVELVLKFFNL